MRYALMAVWLLFCPPALAEVSVGVRVAIPGLSIGINMPYYPDLAVVPGYPVYYAPDYDGNYFFYDGLYWIFVDDVWYSSYWYNGPWDLVEPEYVPVFILRIPVYYYRRPPVYFREWVPAEPPHWGERWGHDWEHRHRDWSRWSPGEGPAPAPLPEYQRQYVGSNYPHPEEQRVLQQRNYQYRPHDAVVRPQYQRQLQRRNDREERQDRRVMPGTPVGPQQDGQPRPRQQNRAMPGTPVAPRGESRQWQREEMQGNGSPRGEVRSNEMPRAVGPQGQERAVQGQVQGQPQQQQRPQQKRRPTQQQQEQQQQQEERPQRGGWPGEGRGGER